MSNNPHKKLTVGQKLKIGAGIGLVVFVVVWEKKRVAALMEGVALVYNESNQESFDDGVKYGLRLAKDIGLGDAFARADAAKYAFDAAS